MATLTVAEALDAHQDAIVARWVERVTATLPLARHLTREEVIDHLREYLAELVRWLASGEGSFADIACQHGLQRLQKGLPVRALVTEYRLLRAQLHAVLGPSADLAQVERLDLALDESAAAAVEAFVDRQVTDQHGARTESAERNAQEALGRAHVADQQREDAELFVAVLGHDLRDPLNAIRTGVSLQERRGLLAPPDLETATAIARAADRMGRMISQLHDFARIRSAGGMALDLAEADAVEIARRAIAEVELSDPGRVALRSEPGAVRGTWDPDRLGRVLSNLLGNALSHGDPAAPIDVAVECDVASVRITVHNQGAIPAELLPHLFDPFWRGPRAGAGLGLGLFIGHGIAHAHGGELTVSSDPVTGTTFTLDLPRSAAPTPGPSVSRRT